MISVTYKKGEDIAGGKLLARYEKRAQKGETSEEITGATEKETYFLLYISGENETEKIIEISAEDVICMTLNLVPGMVNLAHFEFECEESGAEEKSQIIVEHFNGFPFVSKHKEFFVHPLDQAKCLEILRGELKLC